VSADQPDAPTPVPTPGDIAVALERARPRIRSFAARLLCFDAVSSTNDLAGRLAACGAEEGTTVVADTQHRGRGRMGRAWYSPAGAGLYVSIVFRPSLDMTGASAAAAGLPVLTLVAGVALAEALRGVTGLPIEIKWPNDLLVARRKLCGILAEAAATEGVLQYVILGFGINLRSAAYPPELADRATSLEAELGRPIDRGLVLAESLAALAARYREFGAGRFGAILDRWRALSPSSTGAAVSWVGPDGPRRGTTAGIDNDGRLLVRSGTSLERVVAGELTWLSR
jgi:BirA family biotin operon repressor/biotin-[acetyl-CoA-carboxylase] ligase